MKDAHKIAEAMLVSNELYVHVWSLSEKNRNALWDALMEVLRDKGMMFGDIDDPHLTGEGRSAIQQIIAQLLMGDPGDKKQ